MTNEAALIEELARAIGQHIDGTFDPFACPERLEWFIGIKAQAILPIIRAREIAAGERVREAAAEAWNRSPLGVEIHAIRALDIPSILKDEA